MTCIAGIAQHGIVTIAGDSAATNGYQQQTICTNPKVFHVGEVIFGCAGSLRMPQLLQYDCSLPPPPEEGDLLAYLVTTFLDAIRARFVAGWFLKKEQETTFEGAALFGLRGRLFSLQEDYHVEELRCGYHAIGTGADLALGALFATQHLDQTREHRLEVALGAAAYHHGETRAPFAFVSTQQNPFSE